MKRILKWAVRTMIGMALLALVGLVLFVTVLPGWVEGRARSALEEAGLKGASLEVRHVGLEGATVAGLRLGEAGRFRVGQLAVDYALSRAIDGEVDTVTVSDLAWSVGVRDGLVDWAPFSELTGDEAGTETRLPFARVVLRAARLRIDWEGEQLACRLDGEVTRAEDDLLAVDLRGDLAGIAMRVEGTVRLPDAKVDLKITADVEELAAVLARVPEKVLALPGRGGGRLRLDGRVRHVEKGLAFEVEASGEDLRWSGELEGRRLRILDAALTDVRATGRLLEGTWKLDEAEGHLESPSFSYGGAPRLGLEGQARHAVEGGSSVKLAVRDRPGDDALLYCELEGRGDLTDWDLSAIEGSLRARVAPQVVRSIAPELLPPGLELSTDARADLTMEVTSGERPDPVAPRAFEARGNVSLAAGVVALTEPGVRGEDLAGSAAFEARFVGAELALKIDPEARVKVRALSVVAPDGSWRLDSSEESVAELRLTDVLRVSRSDAAGHPAWSAEFEGLRATATRCDLVAGAQSFDDLEFRLAAVGAATPSGTGGRLLAGSRVSAKGDAIAAPGVRLSARETQPALLDLRLEQDAPFTLDSSLSGAWSVDAPAVALAAGADARFVAARTTMEALSLRWTLGITARPAGVKAIAVTEGVASWNLVLVEDGGSGIGVPAGTLRLPVKDNSLVLSSDRAPVSLDARLALKGDGEIEVLRPALGSVVLSSLAATGRLAGPVDAPKLTADLEGVAVPILGRLGPSAPVVAFEDLVDWKASITSNLLDAVGAGPLLAIEGEAVNRKDQESGTLRWPDMKVFLGAVRAEAKAEFSSHAAPVVHGRVTIGGAGFLHRSADVSIDGLSAVLPFSFGAPAEGRGEIVAEALWVGEDLVPGISGTAVIDRGLFDLAFDWPVFETVVAKGAGRLRLFDRIPNGQFTLDLPRFAFGPDTQPADFLVALGDLELGGHAALKATIRIDGPRITPDVTLVLDQVSIVSEALSCEATGIDARVTIDGLAPLSTPGGQRLAVAKGRLGKLKVMDGEVLFQVEAPDRLLIEKSAFGWAGGKLYAHALRFDPWNPDLDLVVYADHLQLGELLDALAEGQATGEGTLYGRLPIRISAEKISYGDFFLYAEPGVGHLLVLDPDGYLASLPERARGALRDFDYSVLKLRRSPDDPKKATLRLRGRSRDEAFPQEVILDVNINGFDDLLDGAIMADRIAKGLPGR